MATPADSIESLNSPCNPTRNSTWKRIVVKFRAAVVFHVPMGYQDETGFHFGTPPVGSRIVWPPMD
jgi:hypothetical protein